MFHRLNQEVFAIMIHVCAYFRLRFWPCGACSLPLAQPALAANPARFGAASVPPFF